MMPDQSADKPLIMISHASSDESSMRDIKSKLEGVGFLVWNYQDGQPVGGRVVKRYMEAIQEADYVFGLISRAALASNDVLNELTTAIDEGTRRGDFADFLFLISLDETKPTQLRKTVPGADQLELIPFSNQPRIMDLIKQLATQSGLQDSHLPETATGWQTTPCSQIATPDPLCIKRDNTINDALFLMEAKRYRHLPVTDTGRAGGRILGIVSRRNIDRELSEDVERGRRPIEDIMTHFDGAGRLFYFLHQDSTIRDALEKLVTPIPERGNTAAKHYVSSLPIVDRRYHVVAILSYIDCLRAMEEGIISVPNLTVRACMSHHRPPQARLDTAFPHWTFSDVSALISNKRRRTVPVVSDDNTWEVLGLITDRNVFRHVQDAALDPNLWEMKALDPRIMIDANDLDLLLPYRKLKDVLRFYFRPPQPDALIVVDTLASRKLVGILSYVDIFHKLI